MQDPEVVSNLAAAKALVKEHAPAELQRLLNDTDLGNNPALVKLLVKLSKR